jgi:exoribonuclease-2
MERYWCLRWLIQEKVQQFEVLVLRENLVRLAEIPLVSRISSLPELPANTRAILEVGEIDLLDLNFNARFISVVEATPA